MKKLSIMVAIIVSGMIILTSCKKTPDQYLNETLNTDTSAVLKYSGDFISGPYGIVTGIGKVYLQNGRFIVGLENFNTGSGPDLKVYISQERIPVNFISLGKLRSTNGNQLYDVPGNPDFSVYKYILIHCEQYNHLFGSAELR
jgi:hypothetical protein